MDETQRIKEVYAKISHSNIYSYHNPSALFIFQEREKAILKALSKNGFDNLFSKRVLDIGCGYGGILRDFINYGALPENCYGIDLLPESIEVAKKLSCGIQLKCENAENISLSSGFIDIIICSTVFSSVLDKNMKQNIAKEMLRVLQPSGIVIWYDFHVDNPRNPDVRGVKEKELRELFPDCEIVLEKIIPAPPILRLIAPYSLILCYLLQRIRIINTHYLGTIRKKSRI